MQHKHAGHASVTHGYTQDINELSTPITHSLMLVRTAIVAAALAGVQTGLCAGPSSLLSGSAVGGPSKPDSKIARNVLEGKSQGYCSVRRSYLNAYHGAELLLTHAAIGTDRID